MKTSINISRKEKNKTKKNVWLMYLLKVLDPSENVFAKFALLQRVRICHKGAEVNPHKRVTDKYFPKCIL